METKRMQDIDSSTRGTMHDCLAAHCAIPIEMYTQFIEQSKFSQAVKRMTGRDLRLRDSSRDTRNRSTAQPNA